MKVTVIILTLTMVVLKVAECFLTSQHGNSEVNDGRPEVFGVHSDISTWQF